MTTAAKRKILPKIVSVRVNKPPSAVGKWVLERGEKISPKEFFERRIQSPFLAFEVMGDTGSFQIVIREFYLGGNSDTFIVYSDQHRSAELPSFMEVLDTKNKRKYF